MRIANLLLLGCLGLALSAACQPLIAEEAPAVKPKAVHPLVESIRSARRALDEAERRHEAAVDRPANDGPEADTRPHPLPQAKIDLERAQAAYAAALAAARDAAVPGASDALVRRKAIERKIAEMQAAADADLIAVTVEKLAALPQATTTLSEDPTRSEMQRADRAKSYNRLVTNLQDRLKSKRSPVGAAYLDNLLSEPENLALLAEFGSR